MLDFHVLNGQKQIKKQCCSDCLTCINFVERFANFECVPSLYPMLVTSFRKHKFTLIAVTLLL